MMFMLMSRSLHCCYINIFGTCTDAVFVGTQSGMKIGIGRHTLQNMAAQQRTETNGLASDFQRAINFLLLLSISMCTHSPYTHSFAQRSELSECSSEWACVSFRMAIYAYAPRLFIKLNEKRYTIFRKRLLLFYEIHLISMLVNIEPLPWNWSSCSSLLLAFSAYSPARFCHGSLTFSNSINFIADKSLLFLSPSLSLSLCTTREHVV